MIVAYSYELLIVRWCPVNWSSRLYFLYFFLSQFSDHNSSFVAPFGTYRDRVPRNKCDDATHVAIRPLDARRTNDNTVYLAYTQRPSCVYAAKINTRRFCHFKIFNVFERVYYSSQSKSANLWFWRIILHIKLNMFIRRMNFTSEECLCIGALFVEFLYSERNKCVWF